MIHIDLSGKNAVVCGSTKGIGRAIARLLAEAGASVTLIARNEERLRQTLAELPVNSGAQHHFVCADFSDLQKTTEVLETYFSKFESKAWHILINNTGGPPPGEIAKAGSTDFLAAFSQHLLVSQMLVQKLIPGMVSERYGRIINIISSSVKQPIPNLGVSNTIRGAMSSWAKTLSFELAKYEVTVNNILPGYIKTSRLDSLISGIAGQRKVNIEEVEQSFLSNIPAGRFGKPEELANLALFLASPLAAYINGANITVDGGRTTAF